MTKAQLRTMLIAKRNELTVAQVASLSRIITSRVIAKIDWTKVKAAHCYVDMSAAREVQTKDLQHWMRRRGIYIKVPERIVTMEELTHHFDLIIVPLVGFDSQLNRIGLGGGFYDRLIEAQPNALKVGLGYDLSMVDPSIPTEEHDQPLDIICTETLTLQSK